MQKLLFKRLGVVLSLVSVALLLLFSGIIFRTQSKSELTELKELINEVADGGVLPGHSSAQEDQYEDINHIIENKPSIYEEALFIVDRKTGEIESITENNEQMLQFEGVDTEEEFVEVLEDKQEGKLTRINGSWKYVSTKVIGDKIIGAYIQADTVFTKMSLQIFNVFLSLLIMMLAVVLVVRFCLKKYMIQDMKSIEDKVKELMSGNYDVSFETQYATEFNELFAILNDWKKSYKSKSERMTRIITSLNKHVAVFECLYLINQNFFSENLQSILGLEEEKWKKIKKSPNDFEAYINHLLDEHGVEEGIIEINHRFINIVTFHKKDEFYGIIIDKTHDTEMRNIMREELHNAQIDSETDPLTKLSNRMALEKYVHEAMERDFTGGVMLIFDLDNFKQVNDLKGHPEGDRVLKAFGSLLKSYFRTGDLVARIGGDEFVVFMDTTPPEEVLKRKLEGIFERVHEELLEYYKKYNMSVSIGAAYLDREIQTYEELYQKADNALYTAKRSGKDTYYIYVE